MALSLAIKDLLRLKLKESNQQPETSAVETVAWRDADDLRWAARHGATRIGVRLQQVHIRPMTNK